MLRGRAERIILFCDDLSFDTDDTSYKSLKAALGWWCGRTPGKRHILCHIKPQTSASPRHDGKRTVDGDQSFGSCGGESFIYPTGLAFGSGFHKCSQDEYLEMITGYANHYQPGQRPPTIYAIRRSNGQLPGVAGPDEWHGSSSRTLLAKQGKSLS